MKLENQKNKQLHIICSRGYRQALQVSTIVDFNLFLETGIVKVGNKAAIVVVSPGKSKREELKRDLFNLIEGLLSYRVIVSLSNYIYVQ